MSRLRQTEFKKYEECYALSKYKMAGPRRRDMRAALLHLEQTLGGKRPYSLLDVGCGRGALMAEARDLGYKPVRGTEIIESLLSREVSYATADKLPFDTNAFDVVLSSDVIEHLVPGDERLAIAEMFRVAKRACLMMINNGPSRSVTGANLHINIRSFDEWEAIIKDHAPISAVVRRAPIRFQKWHKKNKNPTFCISELWVVTL